MKKYKIEVSGRGADCYVYKLTDKQFEQLNDGGVEEDDMSVDDICEVLGIDFITDTETVMLGVYHEEDLYHVSVTDENDQVVWESNNDLEILDEDEDYKIVYDEPHLLICEDLLKGSFYNYVLELEEDFDPKKLTVIVNDVAEQIPLITDFRYDEKKLEVDEFGDYWDKGFNFYLT